MWCIFTRALGLCYALALGAFSLQLPSLSGEHGLDPLTPLLRARRRHFGALAYFYHPTLFWLSSSDAALALLPALGAACGALCVLGGPFSPFLLLVCWVCLLSIDAGPSACVYPWDSLLLEMGFLALWLPASAPFDGTLASFTQQAALPSPLLSFAFRALLFRLLMGFGKLKFVGSGWWDRFYIRGFLINQPMVSPLGLLAHHLLPSWAWVAMLAQMFVVECIMPFGLFAVGLPRALAAGSIAALMLGIWATGNYGYFNLATMALCLAASDASAAGALSFSPADALPPGAPPLASLADAAAHWPSLLIAALLLLYIFPLSALQFIMNSWINLSWAHWGGVYRLRLPMALWWSQAYARLLRALGHWRIVSGYGVFPPASSPPQRWALLYEGSADGRVWQRYHYKFYISTPRSPPIFVAPYHPRLDHAIFYESFGSAGSPTSILGHNNPYAFHSSANVWVRLQVKLLQGGAAFLAHMPALFSHNPFPDPKAPPRHVRVVACQFTPAPLASALATGEWWVEKACGVQHPQVSLESLRAGGGSADWPICDALPEPEEFWCEFEEWRRRAGVCSRGITAQEYSEAWAFLEEVREAAAEVAASAGSSSSGEGSSSGSSGGGRAGSAGAKKRTAGAAGAAVAAGAAPPPPPPPPALADENTPIVTQVLRRHVLLPTPPSQLTAACAALAQSRSLKPAQALQPAPLPLGAANALFTWAALPAVVAKLRARRTAGKLAAIRGTLARMAVPLMRGCARVCDRVVPTRQELESDLRSAALSPAAAAEYLELERAMGPQLRPPTQALDNETLVFAGNDDAGVEGSMGNALRWQCHAHRVMLVEGRGAYEAACAALLGVRPVTEALVSPVPLALHSTQDALARLPRAAAWEALTCAGTCLPSTTASELGTFLLWALSFDALHTLAVNTHRVNSQSRAPGVRVRRAGEAAAEPSQGLPTFLPATLGLMPRIQAHPDLRRGHSHCSSLPEHAGGKGGFLPPCTVPLWRMNQDQSTWIHVQEAEGKKED